LRPRQRGGAMATIAASRARPGRKRASAAAALSGKQAVIVIHGMGEQQPLDTLHEFVDAVYQRDPEARGGTAGSPPRGQEDELNPVSIVPDAATGSAELRRITTHPAEGRRTDFFEFYWADIMDGTPLELVSSWIRGLLLRSPFRVPLRIQVWIAWLALWALAGLLLVLALFALYPAVFEGHLVVGALVDWFDALRRPAAAAMALAGLALGAYRFLVVRPASQVKLALPVGMLAAAAVAYYMPSALAADLRVWASLLWAFFGWAFAALVGPYIGDVVRYVRATPQTVEKRRLVRERGLQLLKDLHGKRDLEGQPYYQRIVIVGHSLGAIIAYDLLQHYWEEAGATHKLDWTPSPAVATAMRDVDAFVRQYWHGGGGPFDMADFTLRQRALFEALRASEINWRISDLITLGSPLVHAEFLMVHSREDLERAFRERRLSAAPPRPDPVQGQGSMLYDDDRAGGPKRGPFAHFAAVFAAVRWTNVYDVHWFPLLGDIVSGPVRPIFGPGVTEHRVRVRRPGWLPGIDRPFTHTRYWTWHASYRGSGVPEHIRHLREALNLRGG
jgi:hypothetical protein